MLDHTLQKLLEYIRQQENGEIRFIAGIEYEMAAEIPLRIWYFDNGGNRHSIGFNTYHQLVTFDD